MKPSEIEKKSFEIIDHEAGNHDFMTDEWSIVRRMIHTSADFDYLKTVRIHPEAIKAGILAVKNGKAIITDTEMAKKGIRKKEVESFGGSLDCFINHPEVLKQADKENYTRAASAVSFAASLIDNGIYIIGNAPTALLRLIELVEKGKAKPSLIIGLPVGFVNAAESKAMLIKTDIPYISNVGRKGGSNVAAAVMNALLQIVKQKENS